jgi:signal transduction histidine kinase
MQLDTQPPLSAKHAQWAEKILTAAQHLLSVINEMLDLARIEAGRVDLNIETIRLETVISSCLDVMEPQARAAGVPIMSDIAAGLPQAQADAKRVRQILLNLLSNAVKYNRRGGWVRVSARLASTALVVDVEDCGQGMTDEQLAQLFQPYNRLGAERSGIEGTGLGLVISRRLANLMRGELRATQRDGGGTRFTLELPNA